MRSDRPHRPAPPAHRRTRTVLAVFAGALVPILVLVLVLHPAPGLAQGPGVELTDPDQVPTTAPLPGPLAIDPPPPGWEEIERELELLLRGETPEDEAAPDGFQLNGAVPPASFEDQVMVLVNQERWANGQLPPLKRDALLDDAAETHSQNMASRDFFAHCDVDTKDSPWDRMIAAGYVYSSAAENIAAGYSSPSSVVTGWMNSSGHRANILSTARRELGIGHVHQSGDQSNVRQDANGDCNADGALGGPYRHYWTQNFGSRWNVYPVVIEREAHATASRTVDLHLYGAGTMDEMRLRNEGGAWSAWMPFSSAVTWTLSAGGGEKTVHAEVRPTGGFAYPSSDTIYLDAPVDTTTIFSDGFESGNTSAWSMP